MISSSARYLAKSSHVAVSIGLRLEGCDEGGAEFVSGIVVCFLIVALLHRLSDQAYSLS